MSAPATIAAQATASAAQSATVPRVLKFLALVYNDLGKLSPLKIAERLAAIGVHGTRGTTSDCPFARLAKSYGVCEVYMSSRDHANKAHLQFAGNEIILVLPDNIL